MPSSTYFATLLDDELVNILHRHAAQDKLHTILFATESPFTRALPLCFNTIKLCPNSDLKCNVPRRVLRLGVKNGIHDDYWRVLQACGRVFNTVCVNEKVSSAKLPGIENLTSAIASCLKSGATLTIFHNSTPFSNSTTGEHVIEAFREYSTNLVLLTPTLNMVRRLETWSNLKRFSWRGGNIQLLDELWKCFGDTLEEVELICMYIFRWRTCLQRLRLYCRRLCSIRLLKPLNDSNVTELDYADFLASYGAQLRYADFSSQMLSSEFCERVARECPRLQCSITLKPCHFNRFTALLPRLLELNLTVNDSGAKDWTTSPLAVCRYLVALRLCEGDSMKEPVHDNYIDALFASGSQSLETLQIYIVLNSSSLRHIAHNTSCLKRIEVMVLTLAVDMSPFLAIAKSNPGLEHVIINEEPVDPQPCPQVFSVISGLLSSFQGCRAMRMIDLTFPRTKYRRIDTNLVNVCSAYRLRPLNIKITFSNRKFWMRKPTMAIEC